MHTERSACFLSLLTFAAVSFGGPSALFASSFSLSSATQACLGTFVAVGNCSIGGALHSGVSTTLVDTFSGSGDTLNVSAAGNAAFGVLNASAEASFNITGAPTNAFAGGGATFIDTITISFAPWNGLPGLLSVNYSLDGTIASTGSGRGFARVVLFFDPNTPNNQQRENDYNSSTSGVFSLGAPLHFTYGQPFVFDFSLFACAGRGLLCVGGSATGAGSGEADFFNTMILSGLVPTDLSGNQAVGAQFSSASGTQYSVNGVVPVPEPASIVLLCTGLATVSRFRRSRSTPELGQ